MFSSREMTALGGIGCLLIAFSPSFAIFWRVIANDPLRIIIFVLGAFFWLLSLLFSALVWYVVVPLRETLIFSLCISIALQELARFVHFVLLKKAQKGLSRMAASGMHISGVHTLHHARHILAVVCGLGMGVMAALFLVINVIADFWGKGTVGLPATVPETSRHLSVKLLAEDQILPVTYSLSACILTLSHLFWTILVWDGCHKKGYSPLWWIGIVFSVASHYVMSALSFWNQRGEQIAVLCLQMGILFCNAYYAFFVMGGNWRMLKEMLCCKSCQRPPRRHREGNNEQRPANGSGSAPLEVAT